MKVNYTNAPGTYYTAFYSIEHGKLYAAYGDEICYTPVFPEIKESNTMYSFFITVSSQEFVDEVLNNMLVHHDDPNKKFSIVLRDKESVVSSNDKIIFAAATSLGALYYATKQIYENVDQFKKCNFTGYRKELKVPSKITICN